MMAESYFRHPALQLNFTRRTLRWRARLSGVCFLDRYGYLVAGMIKRATHSKIAAAKQMENTNRCRIFLLSPAYAGGERARMILSKRAEFELARKLRDKRGAPIGEVFTFLSGLYFRGKIAYATAFARPAPGVPGVLVITPTRGFVDARTRICLDDLREFATVDIHKNDPRYRAPIERDAAVLARKLPRQSEIILLGSIATGKYVNVLLASFGDRLRFPADFVGRGDMSRGGLMLRCAVDRQELPYIPVAGAIVNGKRPPKLAPRRYLGTFR
jgi:hypothetical protein